MLRIFLFGLAKRRIQPERYTQWALRFVEIIGKIDLTQLKIWYIMVLNY
jgi:hypothetical protein